MDAVDEMHWAMVDPAGFIIHVIVCQDPATAKELGYEHLIHHENGDITTQVGIGWQTTDGGQSWTDRREDVIVRRRTVQPRYGG